jgi:hypothetical protein
MQPNPSLRQQLKRLENCVQRVDGRLVMKHLPLTTIAAVVLVGCGESQQSSPPETAPSETDKVALTPPTSPPPEAEPAEPVVETQAQQSPKLKSNEPVGTTIKPVEWENATGGNWDMATRGNTQQIKQLLAEGMEVDTPDKEGMTALYRAAHNDQKETVSLLLEKGADVNIRDKWGNTPLDVTLNDDVANLLRKHGGKTGEELKAEGK